VVVLIVFLMFRRPIRELIPKLRSYEGMGHKVTFGDRLAETEKSVEGAVSAIGAAGDTDSSPSEKQREDSDESASLAREAELNPSFVILSAFEQLSGALADLVGSALGAEGTRPNRPAHFHLGELQKRGIVNNDFVRAVSELRELRNRVAHGQHNPTAGEAVAYVESAGELGRAAHVLADLTMRRSNTDEGT
jgi:hypothetical protein